MNETNKNKWIGISFLVVGTLIFLDMLNQLFDNSHSWQFYTKMFASFGFITMGLDHLGYFASPALKKAYYAGIGSMIIGVVLAALLLLGILPR